MTEPTARQARDDLSPFIGFFSAACKDQRTIGLEFEVIGYSLPDWRRLTPVGVRKMMEGFAAESLGAKWEGDFLVEVELDIGRITLEPGGQIEFSGNPSSRLGQLEQELAAFLARLRELADQHGFAFLACGFDPLASLNQQQWMPKQRYTIMRPYLQERGALAEAMMTQTAAFQCSVDYHSLEDLVKKFVVGNQLGPVVAAMCANSPFSEARLNRYATYRYQVWLDTDPDRCGLPAVVSLHNPNLEAILNHLLDVPMMFEMQRRRYVAAGSKTFREHMGTSQKASDALSDFALHLTGIFTDARLKPHVELRSADCVKEYPLAVSALWTGLLYDQRALDEALRVAPRLAPGEHEALQTEVARRGLRAKMADVDVGGLARDIVEIACYGLRSAAPEETRYLSILEERVREGMSPADVLIRNYQGGWNQEMEPVLDALRIA